MAATRFSCRGSCRRPLAAELRLRADRSGMDRACSSPVETLTMLARGRDSRCEWAHGGGWRTVQRRGLNVARATSYDHPTSSHRPGAPVSLSTPVPIDFSSDTHADRAAPPDPRRDEEHDDIMYPAAIPFVLVHLACLAAFWTGITWTAVALCITLYWLRIFGIGAGYHRYFSHRSYSTSRAFQFILAVLSQSTTQKSVLWWAAKHRHHHLHSDTALDVHSPRQRGFLYSHVGWIFARRHDTTDLVKVEDFARYPELRWLHRFELAPAIALALICLAIGGWSGLVVGFFWSTVLVYHATF